MERKTFVLGNSLVLGALDSQSLGPGFLIVETFCESALRLMMCPKFVASLAAYGVTPAALTCWRTSISLVL